MISPPPTRRRRSRRRERRLRSRLARCCWVPGRRGPSARWRWRPRWARGACCWRRAQLLWVAGCFSLPGAGGVQSAAVPPSAVFLVVPVVARGRGLWVASVARGSAVVAAVAVAVVVAGFLPRMVGVVLLRPGRWGWVRGLLRHRALPRGLVVGRLVPVLVGARW